jgi:hypothetical protein
MHARGEFFLVFGLFCALLLTVGRCCNNKIACVWGSVHGKACAACVKAKQRCRVFGGRGEVARSRVCSIGGGRRVSFRTSSRF